MATYPSIPSASLLSGVCQCSNLGRDRRGSRPRRRGVFPNRYGSVRGHRSEEDPSSSTSPAAKTSRNLAGVFPCIKGASQVVEVGATPDAALWRPSTQDPGQHPWMFQFTCAAYRQRPSLPDLRQPLARQATRIDCPPAQWSSPCSCACFLQPLFELSDLPMAAAIRPWRATPGGR